LAYRDLTQLTKFRRAQRSCSGAIHPQTGAEYDPDLTRRAVAIRAFKTICKRLVRSRTDDAIGLLQCREH
jgi:hypothetical protein